MYYEIRWFDDMVSICMVMYVYRCMYGKYMYGNVCMVVYVCQHTYDEIRRFDVNMSMSS